MKRRKEKGEVAEAGKAALTGKRAKPTPFNRLDFTALVLAESLFTPSAVLTYAKTSGNSACQLFVARNQRKLKEFIADAAEWRDAEKTLALEKETDWQLIQRLANGKCPCEGLCLWSEAAGQFFDRNRPTIDHQLLAASLAKVIQVGPGKTSRVPLIAGPTNACKSTILDPCMTAFGKASIACTPALGSTMPLASLASGSKRFLYWDEYKPTEYASQPYRKPTIPATTFKKLLAGQLLELQVSQSFHDGNPEFAWKRGAALTAPLEGLWHHKDPVTAEDARHMQSRVIQFDALVAAGGHSGTSPCAQSLGASGLWRHPQRTQSERFLPSQPSLTMRTCEGYALYVRITPLLHNSVPIPHGLLVMLT